MMPVVSIVEGDGEVAALPLLLRRLNGWLSPDLPMEALPPIRVRRDRFLNRANEFRRMLLLAAGKCGEAGWILVLLDADDDCPAELEAKILKEAYAVVPHRQVSVVLAKREYEAWFIAARHSLQGRRSFSFGGEEVPDAEGIRGAKEWLGGRMASGKYRETTDQPAFTALMDLEQAHQHCRSFRKLCSEWRKRVGNSKTRERRG